MIAEFKAWEKIPRGGLEAITITEKLDGTNACVIILDGAIVGVQSRKRLITIEDDNYGFARWAYENEADLLSLGDGYHDGEWCGLGIQKNHHKLDQKYFFLFNSARWNDDNPNRPKCCRVVSVLYHGDFESGLILNVMDNLRAIGEKEGYTPEGVVVWYHKTRRFEKYTFRDSRGKWLNKQS